MRTTPTVSQRCSRRHRQRLRMPDRDIALNAESCDNSQRNERGVFRSDRFKKSHSEYAILPSIA
jgi:hypothetical protein